MSHYQENISWETPDGAWSLGVYELLDFDDDGDPTDYNMDVFEAVYRGHATHEGAIRACDRDYGNFGFYPVGARHDLPGYAETVAELELMAQRREADAHLWHQPAGPWERKFTGFDV